MLEGSSPIRITTRQRKKKRWVAQTAYITGEGETELDAIRDLLVEVKVLVLDIEEFLEDFLNNKELDRDRVV